jgi:hypothetical protein
MPLNPERSPHKITAPLHFITKKEGIHYALQHSASTVEYKPREVRITDARPLLDDLALEKNGFILTHHLSAVTDFLDEAQIKNVYLPEIERFICDVTGASLAKVFHWASRSEGGEKTGGRQPGRHAHCDYPEQSYRVWAEQVFGKEQAERLLQRHWMVINVWRGTKRVESVPLALCDASTVRTESMRPVRIYNRPGEPPTPFYGHPIEYEESQQWYYFPLMTPDEVLVFKQFDSWVDRLRWGAHCAFDDPETAVDAEPRSSFEVRALVFFES